MKKIATIVLALSLVLVFTGCGNKQKKYEEAIKEYATHHYNSYQKGEEGKTKFDISILQLKDANEIIGTDYDLKKLEKCTNESYVTLTVDEKTREISNLEYHLDCSK